MNHSIYLLWDPRNGDIRYVGKTKYPEKRLRGHQKGNGYAYCGHWERSLIEEGLACEWAIVEEGLTYEEANIKERWWIAYAKECGWPITNHTSGGDGVRGQVFSEEYRRRLSAAQRKRWKDPAEKEKVSNSLKKAFADPAIRKQMSIDRKKQFASAAFREQVGIRSKKAWSNPAMREKWRISTEEYWSDPANHEKASVRQRKRHIKKEKVEEVDH